jgi:murein DD-endopeptidase MepM/ murein hydrolase activator NlpD
VTEESGGYTVIIVPVDGEGTRSFRVSSRALRIGVSLLAGGAVTLAVVLATWWYFAAAAARVPELEQEVARLGAENAQVEELARTLDRLQREYEKVRGMLGAEVRVAGGQAERPPAAGTEDGATGPASTGLSPEIPTSWPLATSGFVTQMHSAEGSDDGRHPGLDIAVAQDSYIRASGAGVVLEADADSIYGLYVLIEHGTSGYRSMYGHASRLFVAPGDSVRQNQVIALSGNTGRSTAPHLHFEILQDGRPVDPMRLVHQRTTTSP